MSRYFFEIAYMGTNYSGWQRQKTAITVQQTIEDQLAILLQKEIRIHGCGRTDAGVHASQYFFHVDFDADPTSIVFKLNMMLPKDIGILAFTKVNPRSNAQKDAKARTYTYSISNLKDPFKHQFSAFVFENLNQIKINHALQVMIGTHDFKNFCKRPEIMGNTKCTITKASANYNTERQVIVITVTGNRFLHHMIRLLVGNLIKIGTGRLSLEEFKRFIDLTASPKYFELAPAQGLVLAKVDYGR